MVGVKVEATVTKSQPAKTLSNAENIDVKFRKIYPAVYGMFNIVYWSYFMN